MPAPTATYARRLGPHHFAHLRAVAEGLDVHACAERYLGADTKPGAATAHAELVAQLRGVAKRKADPRWRLIGLRLPAPALASARERPGIDEWAAAQGWGDFSQAELLDLYEASFTPTRALARAQRLREKQLLLLRELERAVAQTPLPSDLLEGWFDDLAAARFKRSGLLTLGDLQRAIAFGGRWYRALPAIGAAKAARIDSYLQTLLPTSAAEHSRLQLYTPLLRPGISNGDAGGTGSTAATQDTHAAHPLDGSTGTNRAPMASAGADGHGAGTAAWHDRQAIEAWLQARAGQPGSPTFVHATAKAYRKEAERLLLWCLSERAKPLSSMTAEDCADYMAFLAAIPQRWCSRRNTRRLQPGWTPFAGPLGLRSRQHAINVVAGLFDWLVQARYLATNPWRLVKRQMGDDPTRNELDSRAFTKSAWQALLEFVEAQPPSPSLFRARFLLRFCEATGLRASEMLAARLGDLRMHGQGWVMPVHGKGARNRVVVLPGQAVRALNQYLLDRQLAAVGAAPAEAPLVASTLDPIAAVGYRALYDSMRSWFRRAIARSSLSLAEQDVASRASLHWLRHTCFTRALERGTSLAATQRQAGHADPRTTMRYARTQLEQLQSEMHAAFE